MFALYILLIIAAILILYYVSPKEGLPGPRFRGGGWGRGWGRGPRGRGWYRNYPGWRGAPYVVYDYEGPPIGYAPPAYCTGCNDCNNPLCRYCPQCW